MTEDERRLEEHKDWVKVWVWIAALSLPGLILFSILMRYLE